MQPSASHKAALIYGGRKGIGNSLSNIYSANGYDCIHLSRGSSPKDGDIYLDIDIPSSVEASGLILDSKLHSIRPHHISLHFLCGGGMGLKPADSITNMARVALHNYIFPYNQLRFLQNIIGKTVFKCTVHANFYFSAVATSYSGCPIYVASKTALEGLFKALVKERINGFYYTAFRLGMVNVHYKYFSQLSKTSPAAFNQLLSSNVPSAHFSTTEEVAEAVFAFSKNLELANGMICDVSGGNSW